MRTSLKNVVSTLQKSGPGSVQHELMGDSQNHFADYNKLTIRGNKKRENNLGKNEHISARPLGSDPHRHLTRNPMIRNGLSS